MENYAYIVTYEYAPAYSCSKVVICPTREIAEKTVAAIKDTAPFADLLDVYIKVAPIINKAREDFSNIYVPDATIEYAHLEGVEE